ncbi:hypothetical protein [Helicobacter sp. MIT 01-3238]|uniref:hypothetical protein n=1 Tax=Helicobacter sp. MIT 01-3238 TaxID=398627 RepID=UPI0015F1889B|nr:hypothetical protein [Helicobacter sp. MIT 01-3238]
MESFWVEFVESFCVRFWLVWLAELLSLSLSLSFLRGVVHRILLIMINILKTRYYNTYF